MTLNNGDLATGGEGRDLFNLTYTNDPGPPAVVITDFDTDEDLLAVDYYAEDPLEMVYDPDREAVLLQRAGLSFGILEGLTEADIPNITLVEYG